MKKNLLLFILNSAFCILNSQAQNAVSSISASYEYVYNDSSEMGLPDSVMFTMLKKRITANISTGNTSGVAKIVVMLGSSEGSNDIFYKEFTLGQSGDFGDGTSYHSSGSGIAAGTGVHPGREIYYLEVFAIKEDGGRSESRRVQLVDSP